MTTPSTDKAKNRGAGVATPSQATHAEIVKSNSEDPVAGTHAAANAAEVRSVIETDPTYGTDTGLVRVDGTIGSDLYDEQSAEVFVKLKADLLEEFFYPDTHTPSYRVLYPRGAVVSKAVIDAYNADTERANKLREAGPGGLVDPENPADIDSSTRHSGTYPGVVGEAVKVAEAKVKARQQGEA